MLERNIVLTGFMGSGKTSVGREVARRLGRSFVDLDDLIEQQAGKPVTEIFARDGEEVFRALEAEACRKVSAPAGLVVATGGGAVLSAANREALAAGGTLICLEAEPEILLARLAGADDRPLLRAPDRLARMRALLGEREVAYSAVPRHLDTGRLSVAAAAERVMGLATDLPEGGHRLVVKAGDDARSSYDILIADNLLPQAGTRLLAAGLAPGRCAVVTNPTVAKHHLAGLCAALAEAGFETVVCEAPDGEAYKTLETAAGLYERLADARLSRDEGVIALGGGVIGDMAGFIAATWLRGVPFVQVPTSLLAMVDASVGGKVAVDLPQGKNLVGAFKQPALVLMDPAVLGTLPGGEFRSGLAEVLKTAIIGDPALFEALAGPGPGFLTAMIADTVRVKATIVERDPYEAGDRAWLNLGHTFGHALELVSGYTLRHGEGVALGLVAAAELSADLVLCDPALAVRIRAAVQRLGLPVVREFDSTAVMQAMGTDKKRRGRALRFVLPLRIGEVSLVEDVPADKVARALASIRSTV